ncbi:MAG: sterol desaturase family protein [Candidatus Marinimicrobia bacterium]|nr:sterol desaturase family protein [Candidatus Neomarinimicrobiota bacterium]
MSLIYLPLFMLPGRYFIVAGIFYFIFYVWKKKEFSYLKIQKTYPSKKKIFSEIFYSLFGLFIFAIVIFLMFVLIYNGFSKMYKNISEFGWIYFCFSIVSLIVIHDMYFYFAHRLIHLKKLFFIHKRHHLSVNPTPWAAFSFGPIEAILQIAWLPLIIILIPLHKYALLIWSIFMIVMNVIGHLGYEIFPKNFLQSPIGKILLSSTHHNLHHSRNNNHYGLYFTFWDKIMGTEYPDYKKVYETVKSRPSQS